MEECRAKVRMSSQQPHSERDTTMGKRVTICDLYHLANRADIKLIYSIWINRKIIITIAMAVSSLMLLGLFSYK